MNAQEIISSGILELYCMGLTSATETAEVNQWTRQYPEVAAEIISIQSGLEAYATANAIEPGASVKERIFSTITTNKIALQAEPKNNNGHVAPVHRLWPFWKYAAAASIILLTGSLVFNYNYYNKYQSANSQLATTQLELDQQKELARNMKNDMGVMADKNAMPVSLSGMPDEPEAAARIYWMQNTKDVYIDPSNLPQAPPGKQYQFWAIVDGKPVNGGIISTEINGKKVHIQKMKSFGSAQAFAVSLEDAGPEKPAPTKVMAMGKI